MVALFFTAALASFAVISTAVAPANAGKPENGLQLELRPAPEAWYVLGDTIQVPLVMRNVSDHEISFVYDADSTFFQHVFMLDGHGIPCVHNMQHLMLGHAPAAWVTVKPGEEKPLPVALDEWVHIVKLGTYTVWFEYKPIHVDPTKDLKYPWTGTLASNQISVTIISPEDYQHRANRPISEAKHAGLSIALSSAKPLYHLGEKLDFSVTVKNSADEPRSFSWVASGHVYRRLVTGEVMNALEWNGYGPNNPAPTVTIPAHETLTIPLAMSSEYINSALHGAVTYHAELWIAAPVDAAMTADHPLPPARTVAGDVTITIAIDEADVDRLLNEAALDIAANPQNPRSRALDALCANIDLIADFLPARAKGKEPSAVLANDLMIGRQIRGSLLQRNGIAPEPGVYISATGEYSLQPVSIAPLVGLPVNTKDITLFTNAVIHAMRCARMLNVSVNPLIFPAAETPMEAVRMLAGAMLARAAAEQVYIYRMSIKLPEVPGAWPYLDMGDNSSFSMLLGIQEPSIVHPARYLLASCPQSATYPNNFVAWDGPGLVQALRGLRAAPAHFATADDLTRFFNDRPKHHEQVWIIPLPGTRWKDVAAGVNVVRNWQKVPLMLCLKVPAEVTEED